VDTQPVSDPNHPHLRASCNKHGINMDMGNEATCRLTLELILGDHSVGVAGPRQGHPNSILSHKEE